MSLSATHSLNNDKIKHRVRMSRENWLFASLIMVSGLAYFALSFQRNKKKILSSDLKMNANFLPKKDSPNIIFIVDAAGGLARNKLTSTLKEVGIYVVNGSDPLSKIILSTEANNNDESLQSIMDELLLSSRRTRSSSSASPQNTPKPHHETKVAIFISSLVFRGIGTKLLKNYPFAKWIFAYGTALETLTACPCYSDEKECYPTFPSSSVSSKTTNQQTDNSNNKKGKEKEIPLSMRTRNASQFGDVSNFNKYLNELPLIQQSKMDAWLGAMDLLFTIKNDEDEDNEANKKNIQNLAQHRLNLWFQKEEDQPKNKVNTSSSSSTPSTNNSNSDTQSQYAEQAYETEKKMAIAMKLSGGHGFAPFTLRLAYLSNPTTRACSLQQLLQFLFYGIPGNDIDSNSSILETAYQCYSKEFDQLRRPSFYHLLFCHTIDMYNPKLNQTLSELAFSHKRLLLHDKVILDTILPEKMTQWRLRSQSKKGCGCCAPEEEEEEEDYEDVVSNQATSSSVLPARMDMPGGFAMMKKRRPTTTPT